MKLNESYPLDEVLARVARASEKLPDVVKAMKAAGDYSRSYTVYETINMTSNSPDARVTLTRMNRRYGFRRWEGYMETSAYADGPKTPVAVNEMEYVAIADDKYRNIRAIRNPNGDPLAAL